MMMMVVNIGITKNTNRTDKITKEKIDEETRDTASIIFNVNNGIAIDINNI